MFSLEIEDTEYNIFETSEVFSRLCNLNRTYRMIKGEQWTDVHSHWKHIIKIAYEHLN